MSGGGAAERWRGTNPRWDNRLPGPIDRLAAYKKRMGWQFPYVSTHGTDFPFDFGLALTEEQAQQIPEVKEMIDNPPGWLQEWSEQIGAELLDHGPLVAARALTG